MKIKLYLFLSLVVMLSVVSCSDDDADDVVPEPEAKESFVSRIKLLDLNNPEAEMKTIKFYYDNTKRVTGIHWGATVKGPNAWKIIYDNGRVEFQYKGDAPSTQRYCTTDAQGKAYEMLCSDASVTTRTRYNYDADTLVSVSMNVSGTSNYDVTSAFKWSAMRLNEINTLVKKENTDSVIINSRIIYDEFAPNNTNIDFNIILDILNGFHFQYDAAPMLLSMCGHKSTQLLLRHVCESKYTGAAEKNELLSYQVLSYSLHEGRIERIEVENKSEKKHYQLHIIYKSDT